MTKVIMTESGGRTRLSLTTIPIWVVLVAVIIGALLGATTALAMVGEPGTIDGWSRDAKPAVVETVDDTTSPVTETAESATHVQPEPAKTVTARLSHYWPPEGGPNCARFVAGKCVSATASGRPWQQGVGQRWLACPAEFEFGTVFVIRGQAWTCMDRGGAVVREPDGAVWLDLMVPEPIAPYGHREEVGVVLPN